MKNLLTNRLSLIDWLRWYHAGNNIGQGAWIYDEEIILCDNDSVCHYLFWM
jgi:hypothetical protein